MIGQCLEPVAAKTEDRDSGLSGDVGTNSYIVEHICFSIRNYPQNRPAYVPGGPIAIGVLDSTCTYNARSEHEVWALASTFTAEILALPAGVVEVPLCAPPTSNASAPIWVEMSGAWVSSYALELCAKKKMIPTLTLSIELVRKWFPMDYRLRAYLESDPEDLDQYVVLEVTSHGDPAVDLVSHAKFTEDWSESVRWPISGMILLDLIYSPAYSNP